MSILNDDDGPKDWEVKDEEPPEHLRKKWEEETPSLKRVVCPACGKETSAENLSCVFCEAVIHQESCPVRCFFTWFKRLFRKR